MVLGDERGDCTSERSVSRVFQHEFIFEIIKNGLNEKAFAQE
jgi:hypothetical protein